MVLSKKKRRSIMGAIFLANAALSAQPSAAFNPPASSAGMDTSTGFDVVSGCKIDADFFVGYHAGLNEGARHYGAPAPFDIPENFNDKAGFKCAVPVGKVCITGIETLLTHYLSQEQRDALPQDTMNLLVKERVQHCLRERADDFRAFLVP